MSAGAEVNADVDIAFLYTFLTLMAGLPPQDVNFEEAMDLVGLKGDDRKTFAFNAENTRISKRAARNLSNLARRRVKIVLKRRVMLPLIRHLVVIKTSGRPLPFFFTKSLVYITFTIVVLAPYGSSTPSVFILIPEQRPRSLMIISVILSLVSCLVRKWAWAKLLPLN